MIFEGLPTTPTAEELLDTAFSRAARAGRAKQGVEAQQSMLVTASNVLSDNLRHVVTSWPDFDEVDPFYYELADGLVGVDGLRRHLASISWAGNKIHDLGRESVGRLPRDDADLARKIRKQGFARMSSIVEDVAEDLAAVSEARDTLKVLPEIDPDQPALVVAGYPNVGKTAFVNSITRAENPIASYPFTTTAIQVGHVEIDRIRYQLVDTPGVLDRPAEERNEIEAQTVSALTHLADAVVFLVDASESCGYQLEKQLALGEELEATFDVPFFTIGSKADRSTAVEADRYLTIPEHRTGVGEGGSPTEVLEWVLEQLDYEPELPFER